MGCKCSLNLVYYDNDNINRFLFSRNLTFIDQAAIFIIHWNLLNFSIKSIFQENRFHVIDNDRAFLSKCFIRNSVEHQHFNYDIIL